MLKPTVEVRDEAGLLVAEFWDCLRLDPAPVQELRRHYETRLRAGGRPELIVDLNGVGFAGSAALGGFVAIHRLAKQHNGRLILCNVDPTVLEVLRVTKLENLFEIVADKAAALASTATPAGDGADRPEGPPASARTGAAPPLRRRNRQG
jgi:anti-anti-sigma factor